MKILVGIARVLVGVLFIFSGLIKLNDPVGFSFKLQEYFSAGVLNVEFLIPFSLIIALFLVIFEVIVGLMLLLGYAKTFTTWSLLLMIIFFTFLTFYSAYFNKVTDCGCFGDAIPLVPWESFIKDAILLVFILILFFQKEKIKPLFRSASKWIVFTTLIGCLVVAYYVLMHLPIIDFRVYKVGNNIAEKMEVPEGAPESIYEYRWKFKDGAEEKVIITNGVYPQVAGEFIGVETRMIQEGYVPPVHDFSIEKNGEDFTQEILNKEDVIFVVAYALEKSEDEGFPAIKKATDAALEEGYTVIGLSASGPDVAKAFREEYNLNFDFYFTDQTTLKTMVRSNPGLMKLNKGTVLQKLHWNDAEEIDL